MKLTPDVTHDYPQLTSLFYDPTVRDCHSTEDYSRVRYMLKDEIHRALLEIVDLRSHVDDLIETVFQQHLQIGELDEELNESVRSSKALSETLREISDGDDL